MQDQLILQLRAAFPCAMGIYAFGSRSQGTARPDSDLDLAVLVPGYANPLVLWNTANDLAQALGHHLDDFVRFSRSLLQAPPAGL